MTEAESAVIVAKIDDLTAELAELRKLIWNAVQPGGYEDYVRSCAQKRRYATETGAGDAAASARKKRPETGDLRIYLCALCKGYHLTSTTLETFAERAPVSPEGKSG